MTNAAAMAALHTLRSINSEMGVTQNRISSGLRVETASDNAAYWSIATTMRSDNNAMSTVQDALGLGAAQVDVAYTAMESIKDTLDEIKTKLVAASQPDVDKGKIQSEIAQLQSDLLTFAKSATFSGGNWLDVSGFGMQKIVASFTRDEAGNIALGTIDVDTAKTALFNSDPADYGLLEGEGNFSLGGLTVGASTASEFTPAAAPGTIELDGFTGPLSLALGDSIEFEMTYGGVTETIRIDGEDPALAIADAAGLVTHLDTAVAAAFTGFTATENSGVITITTTTPTGAAEASPVTIENLRARPGQLDILAIDITMVNDGDLAGLVDGVDRALSSVTTAASDLGAIKSRVDSQQDFVSKLMDAVDRGIGQLVDADMNEESTRLKALQTQQQLGVQALSIANQNSQLILQLFQN